MGSQFVGSTVCRIRSGNMLGLSWNLSDLTGFVSVWFTLPWDFCLRFASCSDLPVPGFCRPVFCRGKISLARWLAPYVRDGFWACLSEAAAKYWYLGFVVRDGTFMCSVFIVTLTYSLRWPDFWLFTNINGYRAGWGYARLRMCNCCWVIWMANIRIDWVHMTLIVMVWQPSVGRRPNPCTWWNSWPPDDWCSRHSTSNCNTHRWCFNNQNAYKTATAL